MNDKTNFSGINGFAASNAGPNQQSKACTSNKYVFHNPTVLIYLND
jgi:hypothetical protein